MTAKTPGISARQIERITVALESIASSLKRIESTVNNYDQIRVASETRFNQNHEPVVGIWLTDQVEEVLRRIT